MNTIDITRFLAEGQEPASRYAAVAYIEDSLLKHAPPGCRDFVMNLFAEAWDDIGTHDGDLESCARVTAGWMTVAALAFREIWKFEQGAAPRVTRGLAPEPPGLS